PSHFLVGDHVLTKNTEGSVIVVPLRRKTPMRSIGKDRAVGWVKGKELLLPIGSEAGQRAARRRRQARRVGRLVGGVAAAQTEPEALERRKLGFQECVEKDSPGEFGVIGRIR